MKPFRLPLAIMSVIVALLPESAIGQDAGEMEEPDRWQIAAELSITDQSGNRALRLLTGGLNITHLQENLFRLEAAIESRYGQSEGELVTLNHLASIAFDFSPTSTWAPFVSIEAERDEFKRLDLRVSTGAGAKYTLRRSEGEVEEISISLALLHSYERLTPEVPDEGPILLPFPPETNHLARLSLRARTSHELRAGVTLRHTTFYQPLWDDVASYLLRSDTGLTVLLTERLALSVEYQFTRDARPPAGVEPNDRVLKTGLIIAF